MVAPTDRLAVPYAQVTKHAAGFISDALSVSGTADHAAFAIVRGCTSGLNYQDTTVTAELIIDGSDDGVTWTELATTPGQPGGVEMVPSGGIANYASVSADFTTGSHYFLRARLTATGLTHPTPLGFYGVLYTWSPASDDNGPLPPTIGYPFDTYALPVDQI